MRSIFSLVISLFSLSLLAQKITISDLEVDQLTTPIGLDNPNPKFSWLINSDKYNLKQTHYQIFVAKDKTFSKNSLVWDSGKVKYTASVYVTYD